MKFNSQRKCSAGFTLMEVIVVTVIAVLAAFVLAALHRDVKNRSRAKRIHCVGNLKQLGIAYRGFGIEMGGFPMVVSAGTNGFPTEVGPLNSPVTNTISAR